MNLNSYNKIKTVGGIINNESNREEIKKKKEVKYEL